MAIEFEAIMMADPQTVRVDDTVPEAMRLMREFGIRNLPVVDADGRLQGVFTTVHMIELLLPRAATMEGGLTDLSFVHDTLADVRRRWRRIQDHCVGDFIETEDIPVATTETSLIEVLLLLYQHRTHITIVDEATRKVVGVVTMNKVLEAIMGDG